MKPCIPAVGVIVMALGCSDPVPLPASALPPPTPEARMMRSGSVEGFLVQPGQAGPESGSGILILVDDIDEEHRLLAQSSAKLGAITLLTEALEFGEARAYLQRLAGVESVRVLCRRPSNCP